MFSLGDFLGQLSGIFWLSFAQNVRYWALKHLDAYVDYEKKYRDCFRQCGSYSWIVDSTLSAATGFLLLLYLKILKKDSDENLLQILTLVEWANRMKIHFSYRKIVFSNEDYFHISVTYSHKHCKNSNWSSRPYDLTSLDYYWRG